jgi:hypothetical protein
MLFRLPGSALIADLSRALPLASTFQAFSVKGARKIMFALRAQCGRDADGEGQRTETVVPRSQRSVRSFD